MLVLRGKYNSAKVFTDNIEPACTQQIIELLNQSFIEGARVRIMPDTHAGIGCVIGFTADLGDKVIPNIVGVDIGCGMFTIKLGKTDLDVVKLDQIIHEYIPAGMDTHDAPLTDYPEIKKLYCYDSLKDIKRIENSLGTLGGGNHFIEAAKDEDGNVYIIIHSGSRNLGKQVAKHYQNIAVEQCSNKNDYEKERNAIIKEYKAAGKQQLIRQALNELKNKYAQLLPKYPKDLCYVSGEQRLRYLHDMRICQKYASLNRKLMADIITKKLLNKTIWEFEHFETVHNYISERDNIIRKGAISAYEGEEVLIPINMRDGSLLCVGKGNPDWNYSAPHGAGRLLSRNEAKEKFSLTEFQESMKGIYTTSVSLSTIDECPMAYKPMKEIINNISDTVKVVKILKPIYNFKAN